MPCTSEYIPEKGLALIVATGEIRDEDCRAQVVETVRLLHEHQSNLVEVDCSDTVTYATLPAIYRLPDYATELGAPWNVRVAVVIPQSQFRMETFHFFELVFRNAGYVIQLFEQKAVAEEWLQRPPPVRNAANRLAAV